MLRFCAVAVDLVRDRFGDLLSFLTPPRSYFTTGNCGPARYLRASRSARRGRLSGSRKAYNESLRIIRDREVATLHMSWAYLHIGLKEVIL